MTVVDCLLAGKLKPFRNVANVECQLWFQRTFWMGGIDLWNGNCKRLQMKSSKELVSKLKLFWSLLLRYICCINIHLHFSRHVCDMIDDPTNQTLSNPVLTIRMLYRIQDVQSISKMSYQCIPPRVNKILSKDEVRKANLVRQLPYSDAVDSHDLVESIRYVST